MIRLFTARDHSRDVAAFRRDQRGAATMEYIALSAVVVPLAIAVVWSVFGNGLDTLRGMISGELAGVEIADPGEAPSFTDTLADEATPLWAFLDGGLDVGGDTGNALVRDHDPSMELEEGTVAMSFTMGEDIAGQQTLFSKDSRGLDAGGHLTIRSDDGDLWVRLQNSDDPAYQVEGFEPGSYMIEVADQFTAGETYTLEVGFGPDGLQAFVDGRLVGRNEQGFTGGIAFNTEPVVIGANSWKTGDGSASVEALEGAFLGRVNSVEIYDGQIAATGS